MKHILKIIVVLTLTVTCLSSESFAQDDKEGLCKGLSKLAGSIMESRQINVPLSELLSTLNNEKTVSKQMHKIAVIYAKAAYESPRYSTEKNIKNAIIDFENFAYLKCLKDLDVK